MMKEIINDTFYIIILLYHEDNQTYKNTNNIRFNTTGVTSGERTACSSGAPEFTPSFQWGSCYSIFSFICMFCRSLFVLLYFVLPLCCLFFFDIRILITPLVYSNSSQDIDTMFEFISHILNVISYFSLVNCKLGYPDHVFWFSCSQIL